MRRPRQDATTRVGGLLPSQFSRTTVLPAGAGLGDPDRTTLVSRSTIILPTGRANFESVIRSWDESPQHAFSIELTGQPRLYGIWQPVFRANGDDFDVEIVSFVWA